MKQVSAPDAESGIDTLDALSDLEGASMDSIGAEEGNPFDGHMDRQDERSKQEHVRHPNSFERREQEWLLTQGTDASSNGFDIRPEADTIPRSLDLLSLERSPTDISRLVSDAKVDLRRPRVQLEAPNTSMEKISRSPHEQALFDEAPNPRLEPNEFFASQTVLSYVSTVPSTSSLTKEIVIDFKEADTGAKSHGDESQSEIQSILEQFDDPIKEEGDPDVMSPGPILMPQHPPRKSSLDPLSFSSPSFEPKLPDQISSSYVNAPSELQNMSYSLRPSKPPSVRSLSFVQSGRLGATDSHRPASPMSPPSLHKSLPPVPDPEPDLPFDFHRFLEQLRHRTADPVAKFLRSFLVEFGKKQWMVHEQVKIISDFLIFITSKMSQCEIWRETSIAEFDNAKEGMEKLVMNRLYSQTFSPAIPAARTIPPAKGKRKTFEKPLGLGRRGQHQEDIERDEVLAQKVRIYGWVKEEHLDIRPVGDSGRRFLSLAQQGMLSILWRIPFLTT